ncbi:MAG TPA: beta-propeller fold lactonase family protein [Phycisphaerales bacterium]|nr:beta-propeller fold lactonase family protein [Phycisphaerales bacterium]
MPRQFIALAASMSLCAAASAQSKNPAIFVANNGNLEGSVTSMLVNPDGSLTFVQKLVTGTAPNTSNPDWGTNCYSIAISPDGRHLAIGHASADSMPGRMTIMSVNTDATIVQQGAFNIPRTPMSIVWLDDEHIAVTETRSSGTNRVRVYHYAWEEAELTLTDFEPTGSFTSSLALHASGQYLFPQNSLGGASISSFKVNPGGTLDFVQTVGTGGTYPLGLGTSPNGRWLYAGGGISSGGKAIIGYDIDPNTGMLTVQPGSPYTSPGSSPKQVVVSSDNAYAIAGHGTDATVRTFSIHPSTGALTPTGFFFDVGVQGSLGDLTIMGDLLFVPDRDTIFDGIRGVYSFTLNANGSLTQNGPIVDTQGIGPNAIAAWPGKTGPAPCLADLNGDQSVDVQDLLTLLSSWGKCGGFCPADLNGDNAVDVLDLLILLAAWGPCR